METDEVVERLKKYVKAGAWLVLGLLVLYFGLKLAFALFSMLIPVVFVGGAAYLGYRWWQRKLAPPRDLEPGDEDYDWKYSSESQRRRRW